MLALLSAIYEAIRDRSFWPLILLVLVGIAALIVINAID